MLKMKAPSVYNQPWHSCCSSRSARQCCSCSADIAEVIPTLILWRRKFCFLSEANIRGATSEVPSDRTGQVTPACVQAAFTDRTVLQGSEVILPWVAALCGRGREQMVTKYLSSVPSHLCGEAKQLTILHPATGIFLYGGNMPVCFTHG